MTQTPNHPRRAPSWLQALKTATATLFAVTCLSAPAHARDLSEDIEAFVQGNVLGIFYHELGHALIDLEDVPIFGQEEDAADVFSVVMTVLAFEEDHALNLAYDYALGFDAEAQARDDAGDEIAWWDVHGPDEQRFYNTVCLFHGSNPDVFDDYAEDMGLPEERADYCEFEYEQAENAWAEVLDDLLNRNTGYAIDYTGPTGGLIGAVLADEVAALNEELMLSYPLEVTVARCGEANAYYDPQEALITFCSEFEDHLIALAEEIF